MKLRWKILIAILLAVTAVFLQHLQEQREPHDVVGHASLDRNPLTVTDLLGFYETYNDAYFGNKLPKNTVVDFSEHQADRIGTTWKDGDQFHIGLNYKYASANRVARLFILHEMCHIKYFYEEDETTNHHGHLWRACMLNLEMHGANRSILIDGYFGD